MRTRDASARLSPVVLFGSVFLIACSEASSGSPVSAEPTDDAGEITQTQLSVGELVFDARVAGPEDGEVVILLHGFPQTSHAWRHQLRALGEAGYRAVAPDQRGYSPGARPTSVTDYAIPLLAQDVTGIADALSADEFHLVGHDWGAAIAWVVAVSSAERVLTVNPMSVPHPDAFSRVLSDMSSCQYEASAYFDFFTTPGATDLFLADDGAALRSTYAGLPADDVEVYMEALGNREALDGGLAWYRANVENRSITNPGLGPVTVPALFIFSDEDPFLCRDGAELTADYVTGPYRFEVIEGVDHWIPENAASEVSALLLEHLGAHRPSAR